MYWRFFITFLSRPFLSGSKASKHTKHEASAQHVRSNIAPGAASRSERPEARGPKQLGVRSVIGETRTLRPTALVKGDRQGVKGTRTRGVGASHCDFQLIDNPVS